jgi:ubiquinone/menaquinone biosynthesis C-methylase UbiE
LRYASSSQFSTRGFAAVAQRLLADLGTASEMLLRHSGAYARACELLYTDLSWAYDLAAWYVSGGRWDTWRQVAVAEAAAAGGPIVELGPGTGHGLARLAQDGFFAIGIEPSPQMVAHARRRAPCSALVRARSQLIPLRDGAAAAVLATFPGPWIADPATWEEIERVLRPGGRAVVLASAASEQPPARWWRLRSRPAYVPARLAGGWTVRRGPWGSVLLLRAEKSAVAPEVAVPCM